MSTTPRPEAIFVGDHLAMDFLNSKAMPAGEWIEWLRDGADLVDWLEKSSAIDAATASKFRADRANAGALDGVAEEARTLREWFRAFVSKYVGRPLPPIAVKELAPLNRLLARGDSYSQIEVAAAGDHPAQWRRIRRWTAPDQLLQPIAEAIGDLVSREDFRLIRACEGSACVLMFLDKTKGHARRWCSMAVCGNRAKAAAHRARATGKQS
ncbi:CGNR zinc finger domain-containing protein [Fimbriiglobus ruber]|uniref:Zinc finger CGNR domain-containing protein n=1 Tax=Fimbriiglobus ruber TaxID=1908690 RepID=A0A225DHF3_9BACT|nr:ABATE domain-containing protein [Fimbriiglobus ruber]OWK40872.1 hypothetical protein FRUB_04764 [Fimbriiglobus ruber]